MTPFESFLKILTIQIIFFFFKVDCFGDGKGICQMYSVKSWPQLKNFHHGTYTGDYTGDQTSGIKD